MNNPYQLQAFGLAFLAELVLLAGAAFALTGTSEVKPTLSKSVSISLANQDQEVLKPPEPKPPQPKPQPLPPQAKVQPQEVEEQPKPDIPQVSEAEANAFTQPTPPPPTVVEGKKSEVTAEYAAKVHAAVLAAHHYPPAAASLGYAGRVRVEFHLRDRVPSGLHLMVASGIGMIDRAALQAVQNAQYPDPPAEIQGIDHVYQIWVEFNRK
jgi:protein TonB